MANLVAFGKANFHEKPRFIRPNVVFGTKTYAILSIERLPLGKNRPTIGSIDRNRKHPKRFGLIKLSQWIYSVFLTKCGA